MYRRLSKVCPWAMNLSVYSKKGVGREPSLSKIGPPHSKLKQNSTARIVTSTSFRLIPRPPLSFSSLSNFCLRVEWESLGMRLSTSSLLRLLSTCSTSSPLPWQPFVHLHEQLFMVQKSEELCESGAAPCIFWHILCGR